MTTEARTDGKRSWLRITAMSIGLIMIALVVLGSVASRMSDGPIGPIPGGRLQSGELITDSNVDWRFPIGQEIELQLVEPMGSRTTGVMVHEGELYVACDLGFLWARLTGRRRWILNTIYLFKGWHENAMRDGRVVLRIAGKRYERQAVRVTDPDVLDQLRRRSEEAVANWVSPEPLAEAPIEAPNDIWFFRMDPRTDSQQLEFDGMID